MVKVLFLLVGPTKSFHLQTKCLLWRVVRTTDEPVDKLRFTTISLA